MPLDEPTHEVWGGYEDEYGRGDNPRHLEDCFSEVSAKAAASEWAATPNFYAFVRVKGD